MSELINNSELRKEKLKQLILKLHGGEDQLAIRDELVATIGQVPYNDVVDVEQQLIAEGLPVEEVLKLCDIHSAVLNGQIDMAGKQSIPEGHPVDLFQKENSELRKVSQQILALIDEIGRGKGAIHGDVLALRGLFNSLFDVDKHYLRKEYLLFPYLEKAGITGPPKVMWGKHDEIRELIKASIAVLKTDGIERADLMTCAEMLLIPAAQQCIDMTTKEEEILFPMALDKVTEHEWYDISRQSPEFGFCLYDPQVEWTPQGVEELSINEQQKSGSHVQLPSGSFTAEELLALLNRLPVDITFVDKEDKVKYFSQNPDRIFVRNRAILNRDVRLCHPPASAHIVEKIIDDFKSGRETSAPFWIKMGNKMIYIIYYALRNERGDYLGTLEVSHDVMPYRRLEGEQRILSYGK